MTSHNTMACTAGQGLEGGRGGRGPAGEGHGFLQLLQSLLLLNLLLLQPLYQLKLHCALQAQLCQQAESHWPCHTPTTLTSKCNLHEQQ